jgi:hypothetical protein
MNDHMENLQFAGQSTEAGFHQIDNISADLEVGWAYRLIEKFGTRHVLFESESCKGARYLEQLKVPNSLRQGIITTYHQERVDAEGPRFSTEIRALMGEHGLAYSILNLEKAKAEYFKARADVLLNTQERYLIEFPTEPNVVEALPSVTVADVPEKPHPVSPPPQMPLTEPVPVIAPAISALPGIDLPRQAVHETM